MKVLVSLLPSIRQVSSSTDVAVVIDVLRATSVMTTAIANGAKQIITCEEVTEAKLLAEIVDKQSLLCGERSCRPIAGFDLGNSPAEYSRQVVQGRTLVLTTTNGTHAIAAAERAKRMIVASFLNLQAVVENLRGAAQIHLVCAGTAGAITAEDTLLAGAIISLLSARENLEFWGDETILAQQLWAAAFDSNPQPDSTQLAAQLAKSQGGRNLLDIGYERDLQLCAEINSLDAVPERISTEPHTFTLPAKT